MHWVEAEDTKGLLASIVASSADAIVGLRLDGTVIVWNGGAERLYGWSATEMIGASIEQIVPLEQQPELRFLLEQVAGKDVVQELVTRRRRKDGTTLDVSISVSPLLGEDGSVIGAVKTERDVSHRRLEDAIAESERRLLEALTRTGSLSTGMEALLDSVIGLTIGDVRASVMRVDDERRVLRLAASRLPPALAEMLAEPMVIAPRGHAASQAAFGSQAVSLRDLTVEEDWDWTPALEAGLRSCCVTPIVAPDGDVLGTLDLYGREVGDQPIENLQVVNALARTAALVMDRYRTLEELRMRRATLAALNKINTSLAVELDSQGIMHRVATEGTRLLGAQMGAFFCHPTGGAALGFQTYVVAGEQRDAFEHLPPPARTLLFAQTLTSKRSQRFDDVTKDPRFGRSEPHFGLPEGHPPVRSLLTVPVLTRVGDLLGMLLFGHSEAALFERWHEEVVQGVASQAALALENAATFEDAKQRAQVMAEADRRKDQFLAVLGHELRNPLSAIAAGFETLADTLPTDGEALELCGILRRQVRHMARLVDDLLDMGRITRGDISLRRQVQDVRVPVRRAVNGAASLARQRGVTLHFDETDVACHAYIDDTRIEQVVSNLLHNATKFAPDSEVRIEVRLAAGEVILVVQDTGRGLAPDQLTTIFERFAQVDADSEEGLGLGLSLVDQLVRAHDGRVLARSDGLGQGATFEIRLPAVAPSEQPPEPEPEPEPEPVADARRADRPRHILLVEDQADAARATSMLLERWGHRVEHASSGAEALARAESGRPDVVLLDIGLPDMTGWEVARALKAEAWGQRMFVIALTGLGQRSDQDASRAAGVDRHFVKPVDPMSLRACLQQV